MKEITFKRLVLELLDIIELKRGLLKTLYHLVYSPKLVIDGYRENFRGDYSGPFRILFIYSIITISAIVFFESYISWDKKIEDYQKIPHEVAKYFNLRSDYVYDKNLTEIERNTKLLNQYKESYNNLLDKDKEKILSISEFVKNTRLFSNPLYTIPFTIAIYSFFTFFIFRNYFTKYLEHYCINTYAISIIGIFQILFELLALFLIKDRLWYYSTGYIISNLFIFIFGLHIYSKFFRLKNLYYNWVFIVLIVFVNPINSADTGWSFLKNTLLYNIHLPLLNLYH